MKIEHVALWTTNLEQMKCHFRSYFASVLSVILHYK